MNTVKHTAGPWQIRRMPEGMYTVTRRTPEGGREPLNPQIESYTLDDAMQAVHHRDQEDKH